MKKLIFIIAFLFCGCYTEVIVPDQPAHDYIGVTVVYPLWGHRHYRRHHVFIEPKPLKPISPAHRNSGRRR